MYRESIIAAIICLACTVPCRPSEIVHSVIPGVDFFESESGSYVDIFETSDGYTVEFFLSELTNGPDGLPGPKSFVGSWQSNGWSNLFVDRIITVGEFQIPMSVEFNPFDDEFGGIQMITGADVNLPPTTVRGRPYELIAFIFGCDGECAPGRVFLEYSVTPIEPPLPGDFNYDDSVDFEDFLILSSNYGLRWKSWKDGDATLDGYVGFADFLILSDNFGEVREPQLAAIPEPSSLTLLGLTLCVLGAIRKRRAA